MTTRIGKILEINESLSKVSEAEKGFSPELKQKLAKLREKFNKGEISVDYYKAMSERAIKAEQESK